MNVIARIGEEEFLTLSSPSRGGENMYGDVAYCILGRLNDTELCILLN